jgi:Putative amidoligase enzyme
MTYSKYESKRPEKLIGAELEFFGVHYRTVVAELKRAGIDIAYEGYTHRVMSSWKLVTDVSVTGTGTGLRKGLEIVSPPLAMDEMERQMKIITDVLNELGAKVDRTCGVHIHHEIDDLKVNDIKNIFKIYAKHDEIINSIMPKSRRGNEGRQPTYCKTVNREDFLTAIDICDSIREIGYATSDRYRTINFNSYLRYGTIEFRQHSGTTDFEKIMSWIRITQAIVHTAKEKKSIKMTIGASVNKTMAFNKEIGIYHTEQGVYVRDRKRQLTKLYAAS